MGLCVILGSHGLATGVVMRKLSARESPLRLMTLWLMRLVGTGIVVVAAILNWRTPGRA
jgi:hypothetical protein